MRDRLSSDYFATDQRLSVSSGWTCACDQVRAFGRSRSLIRQVTIVAGLLGEGWLFFRPCKLAFLGGIVEYRDDFANTDCVDTV